MFSFVLEYAETKGPARRPLPVGPDSPLEMTRLRTLDGTPIQLPGNLTHLPEKASL